MRTIFKYMIPQTQTFTLSLPKGARILSLQLQRGIPVMWATVETDLPMEDRKFLIVETGEEIPKDLFVVSDYIGTYQMEHETLVFHLFEIQDPIKALVRTIVTGQ